MTHKKIRTEPKMLIFEQNPLEHSKMVLKEHFSVLIFCLALKKKRILRSRRRRTTMFGAISYSAYWAKSCRSSAICGTNEKKL